jgi:hypothetical protein
MDTFEFRGAAGEVVRGFVRPATLLTLLPLLAAAAFLGAVAGGAVHLFGLSPLLTPLILMVAGSPIIGRFALAARAGDLRAGFISGRVEAGELVGFVTRYAVLTFAWGVPGLIVVAKLAGALGGIPAGGPAALVTAGPAGLLLILTVLALLLAPTLSMLVATRCNSVGEVLSPDAWRWLGTRRHDLVAFYAALVGGAVVFLLVALPPLVALALLAFAVSTTIGIGLAAFAWVVPAAAAPVLLGRLCGAFVAAGDPIADPGEATRLAAGGQGIGFGSPSPKGGERAAWVSPAAAAGLAGADLQDGAAGGEHSPAAALRRIAARADPDLPGAIAEAEHLLRAHPLNANVGAALSGLYQRAGRADDARRLGAAAIERALNAGLNGLAAEVFHRFESERHALGLSGAVLDRLGWVLLQRRALDAAVWCFEAAAEGGGDPAQAEKGLIAVADAATSVGETERALALYRAFLDRHPRSTLAGYARNAVIRLDRGGRGAPQRT